MLTLNTVKLKAKKENLFLRVAKGHFATSERHCNYYIDVTTQKARLSEAEAVAEELTSYFYHNTIVDTILCIDGMEVVGTCIANKLTKSSFTSINAHNTIYVIEPEPTSSSQLLFRDNVVPMIRGKNVLIVAASYTSGKTVSAAIEAVNYYGGRVSCVGAIFATAEKTVDNIPVYSCFDPGFLGDFGSYKSHECPMCKDGKKIDALINGYGYSILK
ncbi:MAG: phosphoribosyltransferase [Clostridia bacterium]|nr:phosphoribosyltransferase [Clostridia bacterium]